MPIRLFNTYSRELEEFRPRDPNSRKIDIYTCGPTVYSRAHIGNFRAYIFEDLLQRHLELRGYKVHRVMNITDVDDKTIRGAREAKKDIERLRIKRADDFPAATDQIYIDKMIAMISTLIARDLAYQAEDKSVYFRINRFPDYGKLAHFDLTQLQSTGRVKHDEYDKEHIGDFALWKAWDEEDGDVGWESPWGRGRPGWHIECSAMATALLGDQIDVHCGGVDNIFPHHEAEIAQSEGCTGKKFVRCWLHCAHLLVDGQKMSKSLGNFYTLADVLEKGYTGREIRYALMRVHYRAPLNFTWDGMEEARHDLNISAALGFLFESIRETNRALDRNELDAGSAKAWLNWWGRVNSALRLEQHFVLHASSGTFTFKGGDVQMTQLPAEIAELSEARVQARLAKDWRKSDELRNELNARGWETRDTKDGQKITRRSGI